MLERTKVEKQTHGGRFASLRLSAHQYAGIIDWFNTGNGAENTVLLRDSVFIHEGKLVRSRAQDESKKSPRDLNADRDRKLQRYAPRLGRMLRKSPKCPDSATGTLFRFEERGVVTVGFSNSF